VSSLRFRTLRQAAALAALLAFAALPHGHLRGHETIRAAWASLSAATPSVVPGAQHPESAPHGSCPLCLSLAQVQSAIVHGAAPPLPVSVLAARLTPPAAPLRADAPRLASCDPRAPPLV
jgi:hypothetical protein